MRRRIAAVTALLGGLLMLGLAACSDETPPPQDFPPLHYEYLKPIRLNIASVDVVDQAAVPDGDLASQSPVTPEAALEHMAHDRLEAAGPSGTATFTITEASITRGDGGALTERLSAHLDVATADGARAAFAEAHVTRTSRTDSSGPAALYDLTRQAMQDMNVEFEYQVRHSLHDWLVSGSAIEAPVQATPLGTSGPLPLAPASPPASGPQELAPPPAYTPPGSFAPPTTTPPPMSPPPGFLAPPPVTYPDSSYPPHSSQALPPAGGGY